MCVCVYEDREKQVFRFRFQSGDDNWTLPKVGFDVWFKATSLTEYMWVTCGTDNNLTHKD